ANFECRGEAVDLRLAVADGFDHQAREQPAHLHEHAELDCTIPGGNGEYPPPREQPQGQATHSMREGDSKTVTRNVTVRIAPLPTFTRARMRSPNAMRPSMATISGFHSAYPGALIRISHTVSGAARMVDLVRNSYTGYLAPL